MDSFWGSQSSFMMPFFALRSSITLSRRAFAGRLLVGR